MVTSQVKPNMNPFSREEGGRKETSHSCYSLIGTFKPSNASCQLLLFSQEIIIQLCQSLLPSSGRSSASTELQTAFSAPLPASTGTRHPQLAPKYSTVQNEMKS